MSFITDYVQPASPHSPPAVAVVSFAAFHPSNAPAGRQDSRHVVVLCRNQFYCFR